MYSSYSRTLTWVSLQFSNCVVRSYTTTFLILYAQQANELPGSSSYLARVDTHQHNLNDHGVTNIGTVTSVNTNCFPGKEDCSLLRTRLHTWYKLKWNHAAIVKCQLPKNTCRPLSSAGMLSVLRHHLAGNSHSHMGTVLSLSVEPTGQSSTTEHQIWCLTRQNTSSYVMNMARFQVPYSIPSYVWSVYHWRGRCWILGQHQLPELGMMVSSVLINFSF
jgi:hypothetical protein